MGAWSEVGVVGVGWGLSGGRNGGVLVVCGVVGSLQSVTMQWSCTPVTRPKIRRGTWSQSMTSCIMATPNFTKNRAKIQSDQLCDARITPKAAAYESSPLAIDLSWPLSSFWGGMGGKIIIYMYTLKMEISWQ